MILGATGHRLHKLPGYRGERTDKRIREALLSVALEALDEWQPDEVISGMATGWDLAVAMAAMVSNIPFRAYVPFEGQCRLWGRADQEAYRGLLDEAKEVRVISPIERNSAYVERDELMVDHSDHMAALYCGDPRSGTGVTLRYADGWLVPWTNYAESYMRAISKTA